MRKRFSQTLPSMLNCLQDPGRGRQRQQQQQQQHQHRRHHSSPSLRREQQRDNRQSLHHQPNLNTIHIPSARLFATTTEDEDDNNNDYGSDFMSKSYFLDGGDEPIPSHTRANISSATTLSSPFTTTTTSSSSPLKPNRSILKPAESPGVITRVHTSPHDTRANTTINARLTSPTPTSNGSPTRHGNSSATATRSSSLRRALASARRRCYPLSLSSESTSASYMPALGLTDADKKVLWSTGDADAGSAAGGPFDGRDIDGTADETGSSRTCSPADSSNNNKKTVRFDHVVAVHPIDIRRRRRRRRPHRHGDTDKRPEAEAGRKSEDEDGDEDDNRKADKGAREVADVDTDTDVDTLLKEADELRSLFL